MNILVTGATGYIGPFLIKKLKEIGHNVTILVRKKEDFNRLEAQGFKCILGDITNKESFNGAKSWVKELQRRGDPNVVIALAGNKADLPNKRKVEFQVTLIT